MRDEGSCFGPTKKVITLSINKKAADIVDTIIHEYAHALDVDEKGALYQGPHQDSWGLQYARCYRVMEEAQNIPAWLIAYLYKERSKNVRRKRL